MASNQIQFVETKYGRLAYRIDCSGGDVPLVLSTTLPRYNQ